MKYIKFSPIILIAVFILYYYFAVYDGRKQELRNDQQTEQQVSQKQWETKTDEQSPVTIKVTPIELDGDIETWRFVIVFDTHSGSLDEDLTKVSVLSDDKGNVYQPAAWEGPGPGGHHREGVLVFNAINPAPMYVELKIKDVGGIAERLFKWNIK